MAWAQLTPGLCSFQVEQQALDVWQGLALLSEGILRGQALLANSSQMSETLQLHVDKAISGLRSLTSLLRALESQVCRNRPSLALCPFCKMGEALPRNTETSLTPPPVLSWIQSPPRVPGTAVILYSLLDRRKPPPFQMQRPLLFHSEHSLLILCANFSESTPISCGES